MLKRYSRLRTTNTDMAALRLSDPYLRGTIKLRGKNQVCYLSPHISTHSFIPHPTQWVLMLFHPKMKQTVHMIIDAELWHRELQRFEWDYDIPSMNWTAISTVVKNYTIKDLISVNTKLLKNAASSNNTGMEKTANGNNNPDESNPII